MVRYLGRLTGNTCAIPAFSRVHVHTYIHAHAGTVAAETQNGLATILQFFANMKHIEKIRCYTLATGDIPARAMYTHAIAHTRATYILYILFIIFNINNIYNRAQARAYASLYNTRAPKGYVHLFLGISIKIAPWQIQ